MLVSNWKKPVNIKYCRCKLFSLVFPIHNIIHDMKLLCVLFWIMWSWYLEKTFFKCIFGAIWSHYITADISKTRQLTQKRRKNMDFWVNCPFKVNYSLFKFTSSKITLILNNLRLVYTTFKCVKYSICKWSSAKYFAVS